MYFIIFIFLTLTIVFCFDSLPKKYDQTLCSSNIKVLFEFSVANFYIWFALYYIINLKRISEGKRLCIAIFKYTVFTPYILMTSITFNKEMQIEDLEQSGCLYDAYFTLLCTLYAVLNYFLTFLGIVTAIRSVHHMRRYLKRVGNN